MNKKIEDHVSKSMVGAECHLRPLARVLDMRRQVFTDFHSIAAISRPCEFLRYVNGVCSDKAYRGGNFGVPSPLDFLNLL